jgi:hypothetical protein
MTMDTAAGTMANTKITGTSGNFDINGTGNAYPWDSSVHAYLAPRACSWANLAAALGAGGFNGSALDPSLACGVIPKG